MPGEVPRADRMWRLWRRRKWPGFHRAWRACRGPGARLRCATPYGSVFALDPYGYIDNTVLMSGFYESEVIEALRGELRPGAVLWDIGANFGLENTRKLAALAGNPQDKLQFIHVAGTNGKGSTCAMLESIYRAAGLRVGLFTSPHLGSFREWIHVNRQYIPES